MAIVYDFNDGHIDSRYVPAGRIGFSQAFRRVEEGLFEAELFEVDGYEGRVVQVGEAVRAVTDTVSFGGTLV